MKHLVLTVYFFKIYTTICISLCFKQVIAKVTLLPDYQGERDDAKKPTNFVEVTAFLQFIWILKIYITSQQY